MNRISTATTATVVRGRLAASALGERVADGAQRRLEPLREEPERGAQAAEYAMLGGVSAAACGGLVWLFRDDGILRPLVDGILKTMLERVQNWFS